MAEAVHEQEVRLMYEIVKDNEKLATIEKVIWTSEEGEDEDTPNKGISEAVGSLVSKVKEKCNELDVQISDERQLWLNTLVSVLALSESIIQVTVAKKQPRTEDEKKQEKADA